MGLGRGGQGRARSKSRLSRSARGEAAPLTFCLHMHTEEALKAGETAKRLVLLDAWRESNLYTERERAALTWTESLTRIAETHAPDADFELVRKHFSQDELIALSINIAMINAFNRLAIEVRGEHPSDVPMRQAA